MHVRVETRGLGDKTEDSNFVLIKKKKKIWKTKDMKCAGKICGDELFRAHVMFFSSSPQLLGFNLFIP